MSTRRFKGFTELVWLAMTDPGFDRHNELMAVAVEFLAFFTPEPGDARIDLARRMAFAAQGFAFHETEDSRLALKRAAQMFYVGGVR